MLLHKGAIICEREVQQATSRMCTAWTILQDKNDDLAKVNNFFHIIKTLASDVVKVQLKVPIVFYHLW
jgi:hypothetical protein